MHKVRIRKKDRFTTQSKQDRISNRITLFLFLMFLLRSRCKKSLVTVLTAVWIVTNLVRRNHVIHQAKGLTEQFPADITLKWLCSVVESTSVPFQTVHPVEIFTALNAMEWFLSAVDSMLVDFQIASLAEIIVALDATEWLPSAVH